MCHLIPLFLWSDRVFKQLSFFFFRRKKEQTKQKFFVVYLSNIPLLISSSKTKYLKIFLLFLCVCEIEHIYYQLKFYLKETGPNEIRDKRKRNGNVCVCVFYLIFLFSINKYDELEQKKDMTLFFLLLLLLFIFDSLLINKY